MSTVDKRPSEGVMPVLVTSSLFTLSAGDSHAASGKKEEEQKGNKKMKTLNNSPLTICSATGCCLAMQINTLNPSEGEANGE